MGARNEAGSHVAGPKENEERVVDVTTRRMGTTRQSRQANDEKRASERVWHYPPATRRRPARTQDAKGCKRHDGGTRAVCVCS